MPALPTGAWIAVGLVLGLALSPVAAQATGALTGIVGSNGSEAGVTLSNHLLTAESAPTSSHGYHFFADSTLCQKIATTPATAGYILKQIVVDTYSDPTPGSSDAIEIWTGTGCSGFPLASIHAGSVGLSTFTFNPGEALAPGSSLYGYASGNIAAQVWLQGYGVPAASVKTSSTF